MLYSYLPHYEMSWTLGHLRYVSYALAQSAKWKFLLHFSHSISLMSETQTEIECPILSDPLMATSETIEEAYTGRSMPQDLLVQIPSSKIVFCRLRQRSVEVCTSTWRPCAFDCVHGSSVFVGGGGTLGNWERIGLTFCWVAAGNKMMFNSRQACVSGLYFSVIIIPSPSQL